MAAANRTTRGSARTGIPDAYALPTMTIEGAGDSEARSVAHGLGDAERDRVSYRRKRGYSAERDSTPGSGFTDPRRWRCGRKALAEIERQIAAHHLQERSPLAVSNPMLAMRSTSSAAWPRPPREQAALLAPAVDARRAGAEFLTALVKRAVTSPRPFNCDHIVDRPTGADWMTKKEI